MASSVLRQSPRKPDAHALEKKGACCSQAKTVRFKRAFVAMDGLLPPADEWRFVLQGRF